MNWIHRDDLPLYFLLFVIFAWIGVFKADKLRFRWRIAIQITIAVALYAVSKIMK